MSNCTEIQNMSIEYNGSTGYHMYRYAMPVISVSVGMFYSYILIVILTNLKELGNVGYNICLCFIGMYDLLMLVRVGIIETIFDAVNPGPPGRTVWLMFVFTFLYYGQLLSVSLLTINRVIAILFTTRYVEVFTPKRSIMACTAVSFVGLLLALPSHIPGVYEFCGSVFKPNDIYGVYYSITILAFVLGNLGAYIKLYLNVYKQRQQVVFENRNTDYKILLQSFFIFIAHVLLFVLLTSIVIIQIVDLEIIFGLGSLLNMFNSGVNPFLYLAFSSKIRNIVTKQWSSIKIGPQQSMIEQTAPQLTMGQGAVAPSGVGAETEQR